MRLRAALLTVAITLTAVAPALAHDNGEGLAGETDGKRVTVFSLRVLLFFVLVVVIGTILQNILERRKDAQKAAKMRQRVGW